MKFFWYQGIFFVNCDLKNGCKNKFEDNNEKSCSRFKNRVPLNPQAPVAQKVADDVVFRRFRGEGVEFL